jgi:hypothetical protein
MQTIANYFNSFVYSNANVLIGIIMSKIPSNIPLRGDTFPAAIFEIRRSKSIGYLFDLDAFCKTS